MHIQYERVLQGQGGLESGIPVRGWLCAAVRAAITLVSGQVRKGQDASGP